MTVVEAWRARLLILSPVTTLVVARIYPLAFKQGCDWPAVRLTQIGRTEFMHLRGSSRVNRARIQVDSVADVAGAADPYALAHALDAAIHGDGQYESATGMCGWRGDIGSPAFEITGIIPDPAGEREFMDEDGDQRRVRVTRDYLTWFIE
jgi:hypothetical protein